VRKQTQKHRHTQETPILKNIYSLMPDLGSPIDTANFLERERALLDERKDDFSHPDQVPWKLISLEEPGSYFTFADDNSIHAAMVGAPFPVGLVVGQNAAASAKI
jgi:hypothetical protein